MFLGALLRLLVERLPEHSPTQQQRNSQDPGWILGCRGNGSARQKYSDFAIGGGETNPRLT